MSLCCFMISNNWCCVPGCEEGEGVVWCREGCDSMNNNQFSLKYSINFEAKLNSFTPSMSSQQKQPRHPVVSVIEYSDETTQQGIWFLPLTLFVDLFITEHLIIFRFILVAFTCNFNWNAGLLDCSASSICLCFLVVPRTGSSLILTITTWQYCAYVG